jgi:hypothetical protein
MTRDAILPGVEARILKAGPDGNYVENDWRDHPDGENYRARLGAIQSPDVQRRAAELLATLGPRIAAVNERYAKNYGWTHGPQRRFWEEPAYQQFKVDDLRPPRPG